jgi:hypothetical protein
MLIQAARIGVGIALFSPLVRGVGKVVGSVFEVASDTVTSAHKVVCLGNKSIHRSTEVLDLKSQVKTQVAKANLVTLKQESLIKFGENTEALKVRYSKLDADTQKSLEMWEARFPSI